ncbi:MAG: Hemolysin transporter protein ShlB [Catillopecten margaritatus gill symbiont]|uniref:Hemolysin transporter protein ShlB n=1 Tax=Catillopecten margaritatus gill symbiont TaxID=3083288 RepID=A0AAU6PH04_9GAMM
MLSIYHKNTKNYFVNRAIDVSSYKITLAQVDFIHTHLQSQWQLTNTYSYYQGVDWFGARDDDYVGAESDLINSAILEFKKFSVDSKLLYYFQDRSYSLNSNFHLQHTRDILYDNDKKTVGSSSTVRGYDRLSLFGNNAWYIRNDLSKSIKLDLHPKLLKTITPFIGLDYGKVKCESDNNDNCGEIAGGAIGFQTSGNNLSTAFVWSRPLKKLRQGFKKEQLFTFNASWKF